MQKSIMAASDEFDVVLNRLDYMTNQAAEGGLVNFYDLEKLDVSDPWWDKNIVESLNSMAISSTLWPAISTTTTITRCRRCS